MDRGGWRWTARVLTALVLAALLAVGTGAGARAQTPAPEAATTPSAADVPYPEKIATWDKTAAAVESLLEKPIPDQESLTLLRQEVEKQRADAAAVATAVAASVAPLEAQLAALGPKPEEGVTEPAEIAERRATLEKQIAQAKARLGESQLAATRAQNLAERLAMAQRKQFTERLLSRGPRISDPETWRSAAQTAWSLTGRLADGAASALAALEPTGRHAALVAVGVATLLFFGFASAWTRARVERMIAESSASAAPPLRQQRRLPVGFALMAARAAPPSAAALALAALFEESGLSSAVGALLVWRVAEGVALVATVRAIARLFFAPRTPEARLVDLGAGAGPATRAATLFFTLVALQRVVIDAADAAGSSFAMLAAANAVIAMLAGPVLYSFIRRATLPIARTTLAALPGDEGDETSADENARPDREVFESAATVARFIGLCIAVAIPVSAVLGYFALSRYLTAGAAMTLGLSAALAIVYIILTRAMRSPDAEPGARRGLGPVLVGLVLAIAAAPVLAAIWGATAEDLQSAFFRMLEGVQVGELRLTLADFLIAIGVAVVGFWLTRFVQGLLRRAILPQTKLDTGVQTSVTTGVGYVGALLTMLVAVSAVGLDLSSLAIVAGALSVGIGFGLQAIVNNFVSGIILLIERPVRVGDWIEVSGAQGIVQRINVRSTEIETFDRQSVIVPNSELLTNHLTNYTHRNLTGRVHCRVGVSYDSDPDQVLEILLEVARAHSQVLRYPQPVATFNGFGDSSLDFELRAFIRDVNQKLGVTSDLNLAILKALRAAEIEIPYPQRDLHLRSGLPTSLGGGEAAMAEAGYPAGSPAAAPVEKE